MTTVNFPTLLNKKAQAGVLEFHKKCTDYYGSSFNIREQMRQIDLEYMRENDQTKEHTRARLSNKYGDPTKFQNITVPIILPQVESAVTYQASVFLTGEPIFGVSSNPASEDMALQMETVIEDQATRGGWVREFLLFFRDGFKYNLAGLECNWDREVTAALETDLTFKEGKEARPKEIIWSGNVIKRLDPYNLDWDTRVAPTEVHKLGEWAGYTRVMSRVALKSFIEKLPYKTNIKEAFESGLGAAQSYYVPELNPNSLLNDNNPKNREFNWLAWAQVSGADQRIQYRDIYEVTTRYARIIPADFGIETAAKNTPQIWKFIIVNHQVIIYAERQTNAHGYLPILLSQPLEDGLGYQTKSLAANVAPIQSISSALANSMIASRRRAISDRVLYDPSRVAEHHINSDNPSAKIPVRPSAYGKPVSESVYQFPYRDDQAGLSMQEIQSFVSFANHISGQNQARQGQFVKGNKTLQEYSDVMAHANGRDQMVSLLLEAQVFTPIKEMLKINILQYQGGVSLFNRAKQKPVTIDPVALRKAVLEFKVSDGLIPTEKLMDSDSTQVAMQVLGSSEQLGAGYDLPRMFSYLMKIRGAQVASFEKPKEQIAYEQALAAWQAQCAQMKEVLMKGIPPIQTVEQLQAVMEMYNKSCPMQPKPQDFGYNPQGTGQVSSNNMPAVSDMSRMQKIS